MITDDHFAPADSFVRRARFVKAVDGDTYRLDIDCGFDVWRRIDVRLRGVDAPELPTPEGIAAQDYAEHALSTAAVITVQTLRTRSGVDVRSFVRYVADVWLGAQRLDELLLAAGVARRI